VPVKAAAIIVPIGVGIVAMQVFFSYRTIANIFKWLALALFAYVGAALLSHPNALSLLKGTFVPTLQWNANYLAMLVAILGTTISPYMFFWQAIQEVEEDVEAGRRWLWQRKGTTKQELRYTAWDINIGMLFSNVVAYFIIAATAATLFRAGHHSIASAEEAARALAPLAGKGASVLFAFGMLGAGVLAVPILTGSAAYALASAFGWRWGLAESPQRAYQFYGVMALSTVAGLEINFLGINPMSALVWTAVINGILAPPLLVLIMLIANNKKVMGNNTNGPLLNWLGWLTTAAMGAAAVGLFLTWGR
jgi:Mn2+/Fe2+ NRAMP family transporter